MKNYIVTLKQLWINSGGFSNKYKYILKLKDEEDIENFKIKIICADKFLGKIIENEEIDLQKSLALTYKELDKNQMLDKSKSTSELVMRYLNEAAQSFGEKCWEWERRKTGCFEIPNGGGCCDYEDVDYSALEQDSAEHELQVYIDIWKEYLE